MYITVKAYDGKEFKGSDANKLVSECNAYEASLKSQREKELAEKKEKEARQEKDFDNLQTAIDGVNKMFEEYEKKYDCILSRCIIDGNLCFYRREYDNSAMLSDILKVMRM